MACEVETKRGRVFVGYLAIYRRIEGAISNLDQPNESQ